MSEPVERKSTIRGWDKKKIQQTGKSYVYNFLAKLTEIFLHVNSVVQILTLQKKKPLIEAFIHAMHTERKKGFFTEAIDDHS